MSNNMIGTTTVTRRYMLTTIDNPYNPYTQFDMWYGFDNSIRVVKGSRVPTPISTNCCGKLADEAITSYDMTDEEYTYEVMRAVDQIIEDDDLNLYARAYEPESSHES